MAINRVRTSLPLIPALIFGFGSSLQASAALSVRVHLPEGWKAETSGRLERVERKPAEAVQSEWVVVSYPRRRENRRQASPIIQRYTPEVWQALTDGKRYEILKNSFFANTREKSNSGLHHKACYLGPGSTYIAAFLAPAGGEAPAAPIRYLKGDMDVSLSQDEYLVGIESTMAEPNLPERAFHFRMPACDMPLKNLLVQLPELQQESGEGRAPQSVKESSGGAAAVWTAERTGKVLAPLAASFTSNEKTADRKPQSVVAEGFQILDPGPATLPAGLTKFKLASDYEAVALGYDEKRDRPWKGMDLTQASERERLATLLLDYFYEGMIDQNKAIDRNLDAYQNNKRGWCQMPWLNVGDSGREAIHGLTRERPLEPSPIYPDVPWGSDWGVGYYNAPGCRSLHAMWGDGEAPRDPPVFQRAAWNGLKEQAFFDDAAMAVKVLFTTADFPALKGAPTWKAHVTTEEGSNVRKLADVRLLQIDIALKDSSLKGTKADLDHWIMLTYYFDSSYQLKSSRTDAKVAHKGWYSMRPVGVQLGLEEPAQGGSHIFAGSKTNGNGGRLNGPADNPKSSCLGCHGTAGTRVFMAPGFMSGASYLPYRAQSLEFSQQLAMAKRNYETRAKRAAGRR